MGEIAGCAGRTQGAAFLCGAIVTWCVGPEARKKRRQAARSPKAGATLGPILLIHVRLLQNLSRKRARCLHSSERRSRASVTV